MTTEKNIRKKYVRFKWWQYGRWFSVIILLSFFLGVGISALTCLSWCEGEMADLIHKNEALRETVLFFQSIIGYPVW